jgi:protocatechuate 3,4-dioxygenase beta subunit
VAFNEGRLWAHSYEPRSYTAYDSADGTFRLEEITTGDVMLRLRAKGYAPFETVLAAASDQPERVIEVRMKQGVALRGTVRDTSGAPMPETRIFFGQPPRTSNLDDFAATTTDSAGSFSLDNVSPDVTSLSALHEGYALTTVPVSLTPAQENKVDVVLKAGVAIEGTVYFGDRPWPGQKLEAALPKGNESNRTAVTDAKGRYRIDGLTPGTIMVLATVSMKFDAPTKESRRLMQTVTAVDGASAVVDFNFAPATASIKGRVTRNGEPVANASVDFLQSTSNGEEDRSCSTAADGTYAFEGVAAGHVILSMHTGNSGESRFIDFDVEDGQSLIQDIELTDGAALAGQITGLNEGESATLVVVAGDASVTSGTATDVGQALLSLRPAFRSTVQIQTNGPYRLSGLQPGRYTLVALAQTPGAGPDTTAVRVATAAVDVSKVSELTLDLDLR